MMNTMSWQAVKFLHELEGWPESGEIQIDTDDAVIGMKSQLSINGFQDISWLDPQEVAQQHRIKCLAAGSLTPSTSLRMAGLAIWAVPADHDFDQDASLPSRQAFLARSKWQMDCRLSVSPLAIGQV